jgi:hypothetical protein
MAIDPRSLVDLLNRDTGTQTQQAIGGLGTTLANAIQQKREQELEQQKLQKLDELKKLQLAQIVEDKAQRKAESDRSYEQKEREIKQRGVFGEERQNLAEQKAQMASEAPAKKIQLELSAEKPRARVGIKNALSTYDQALSLIDRIEKNPDLKSATGIKSLIAQARFGSGAKKAATDVKTLKNQVFLNTLTSLKAMGKNGSAGLGALSNIEGARLENSIAPLSLGLDEKDVRANLALVKQSFLDSKQRLQQGYKELYGEDLDPRPSLDSFVK